MSMARADAAVIGGGFYGCCLALFLRGFCDRVVVLEKEKDLLTRASAINQARVHTGFHYPRSFLTAYRSFINFPRFVLGFRKAIIDDFIKIYAIARRDSKVNARRFHDMFTQMNARIAVAAPPLKALFNAELIEEVFQVEEVAFDASILRGLLRDKLAECGVEVLLGQEVTRVEAAPGPSLLVRTSGEEEPWLVGMAFNCTYSQINKLLRDSGIELLPFKHELTEMALVEVPEALQGIGITVMDGPFFSTMPYPSRKLHSLSHVRYTPHHCWRDQDGFRDGHRHLREYPLRSNYPHMLRDAQRYVPSLRDIRYVESLYEIKTILQQNESDDGRPILFKQNHGLQNFSTIMGGKIDNIYDILEMIGEARQSLGLHRAGWPFFGAAR